MNGTYCVEKNIHFRYTKRTWPNCTKRKKYEEIKTFIKDSCRTLPRSDQGVTFLEGLMQTLCHSSIQLRTRCHADTTGRYLTPSLNLSSIHGPRGWREGREVTERRLGGAKEMGRQGCTQDSRLLLLPKEGLRKTRVSCLPYLRDKGLV